jgi:ABC-type sulfate transport system permease component
LLEEVDGVSIPNEEDIKAKLAQFRAEASKIKGTSKIATTRMISIPMCSKFIFRTIQ